MPRAGGTAGCGSRSEMTVSLDGDRYLCARAAKSGERAAIGGEDRATARAAAADRAAAAKSGGLHLGIVQRHLPTRRLQQGLATLAGPAVTAGSVAAGPGSAIASRASSCSGEEPMDGELGRAADKDPEQKRKSGEMG